MPRSRRTKKPSAASVLEGMAGGRKDPSLKVATKPPPKKKAAETTFGKLAARNSSIVVSPDIMNEFADRICREDRGVYELTDFALPGFEDAAQIVCHPAFIRAAAKRGRVFYVDAAKKVRAATVHGADPASAPITHTPDPDAPYFKRQPWHGALEKFVDRGVPVLLIGPAGCGKSHSTELLFEAREQNLEIVSCRPDMEAQDLNGHVEVTAEEGVSVTKYVPSPAARAAEHGYGLLLDEMDALRPEAAFSLYRVIDGKSMFIPSGEIELHPEFRVVATQNTEGRGDDKGVFHGRAYQDDAFLDRWEATIRVDYPTPADEVEILMQRTGIDKEAADQIINCAGLLRRAYNEHNLMRCCTMRRTLAVATNLAAGFKNHDAWLFGLLNQVTPSDSGKIKDILIRIYGSKINKKKLGA